MNLVDKFIHKYSRLPTERDPDYLEMLRMSKYTIEDVPYFAPGKCANCGASKNDGRRYINIGLDLEWYGFVYFCGECIKDIANTMGLFDNLSKQLYEKEGEIAILRTKLDQGVELPEKLVKVWEEFKEYYASLHPIGNDVSPNTSSMVDIEQPAKVPAISEQAITSAKSRTSKSTTGSRSKDLPSLAELLENADG